MVALLRATCYYRRMASYHLNSDCARKLELSDDECLWLCRMIVGERGSRLVHDSDEVSALLWAIVNRWFLHPGRKHWRSFTFMLRRFSQPINPRWMEGGDLALRYKGRPEASPARLRRRARMASLPLGKIPAKVRRDVELFRRGLLPPPACLFGLELSRISNWASYRNVERKFPHGVKIKGNWFLEDLNLRPGHVVIDYWG